MLGQTLAKPEVRECLQPASCGRWCDQGVTIIYCRMDAATDNTENPWRFRCCFKWKKAMEGFFHVHLARPSLARSRLGRQRRSRGSPCLQARVLRALTLRGHPWPAHAWADTCEAGGSAVSAARVLRALNADWRACGFGKPGNVGCRCMLFREYHSVHDGCADFSTSDSAVMRCSLRVRLAHR